MIQGHKFSSTKHLADATYSHETITPHKVEIETNETALTSTSTIMTEKLNQIHQKHTPSERKHQYWIKVHRLKIIFKYQ